MNTYTAHFRGSYSWLQRTFTAANERSANETALEKAAALSKEHGDEYRVVRVELTTNQEH